MKELDALQQSLNVKLRSSHRRSRDGHTERHSSVMVPPPLDVIDSTERMRVDSMEQKSPRTDFEGGSHRHVVMPLCGDETSILPNDEHRLASLISPLETEHAGDHKLQTTERIIDVVLDKGAGTLNFKETFPFDSRKEENLMNDPAEDSFFSVEKQKSLAEDRRLSVDSEFSVSDISGDLSVSGYVQDNRKSTRFTDLKDSWISSEEEGNTNMSQSEKPGWSNTPSATNADSLNNASDTNFYCHGIDHQASNNDAESAEYDANGDKDCHLMQGKGDGDQSPEGVTENYSVDAVLTTGQATVGSLTETADDRVIVSESDHENEPTSYSSYNTLHSRQFPKQSSLSAYPTSYPHTSTATLPNFFMPSEQLEESMRALRLGTSNNNSHSKLLSHSSAQQTKGNLTEKFAKRQPVYKARSDGRPPISNSEVDRIAKIFNSGSAS